MTNKLYTGIMVLKGETVSVAPIFLIIIVISLFVVVCSHTCILMTWYKNLFKMMVQRGINDG